MTEVREMTVAEIRAPVPVTNGARLLLAQFARRSQVTTEEVSEKRREVYRALLGDWDFGATIESAARWTEAVSNQTTDLVMSRRTMANVLEAISEMIKAGVMAEQAWRLLDLKDTIEEVRAEQKRKDKVQNG